MKRYLLDTTPLAAYLQGRPAAIALIAPWIAQHEVATSILAYGEVVEYLLIRGTREKLQPELRELLAAIRPYFLTYPVLDRYAEVRQQLAKGPGLIGDIDTLLAVTALERNLTAVTVDTDFQRVPGLKVMLVDRAALRAR